VQHHTREFYFFLSNRQYASVIFYKASTARQGPQKSITGPWDVLRRFSLTGDNRGVLRILMETRPSAEKRMREGSYLTGTKNQKKVPSVISAPSSLRLRPGKLGQAHKQTFRLVLSRETSALPGPSWGAQAGSA